MRFFYRDQKDQEIGPYTMDELRQLHLNGIVTPDTPVVQEEDNSTVVFKELWASRRASMENLPSTTRTTSSQPPGPMESFTRKAGEDLRALTPHLLLPFDQLRTFRWSEKRTLLFVAAIGLSPLLIDALFTTQGDLKSAYWAVAFYFSVWWGLLFYHLFPAPAIDVANCVISFLGTGIVSIGLLLPLYQIPPLSWLYHWTRSYSLIQQIIGCTVGVGLPEEVCKMAVLFFLLTRAGRFHPRSMLFYGLMAGLGFGIYEGVGYQMGRNVAASGGYLAPYYLWNVMRLTSVPFLHAIWTATAGYFLAFAWQYPKRKAGLIIVAVALPSLFHSSYDLFALRDQSFAALGVALMSVVTLYLYLGKTQEFERGLGAPLARSRSNQR